MKYARKFCQNTVVREDRRNQTTDCNVFIWDNLRLDLQRFGRRVFGE